MLWDIHDYEDVMVSVSWKRSIVKEFAFDKNELYVINLYLMNHIQEMWKKKLLMFIDYLTEILVKYNSWWSPFFYLSRLFKTISSQCSILIPLESVRKPKAYWVTFSRMIKREYWKVMGLKNCIWNPLPQEPLRSTLLYKTCTSTPSQLKLIFFPSLIHHKISV